MNLRPAAAAAADRAFFGHPRGLAYLLGAEVGWAFAYYGMANSLTLYMTQTLLKPGVVERVWGLAAYRATLQHLFGALSDIALASQTFGLATGAIYALPIVGGFIADRWTGQARAGAAGCAVLVLAHLLLIRPETFLPALALMVLGTGLLKTSLVGQIGRLYGPDDDRRTRGFGLYLIALNTGSFLTPLVSGTLGERVGWGYGYIALAVGMTLGAAAYVAGLRHMPPRMVLSRPAPGDASPAIPKGALGLIGVILFLIVIDGVWSGVYNQAFNIFPVWADTHVDRRVLGFDAPVTWFSTVDGILTIVGAAVAVRIWALSPARSSDGRDIGRVAIGLGLATASFLFLALGAKLGGSGRAPLWTGLAFFLFADFAIAWVDTSILTMVSRDSPPALTSTLLGVYYLATAGGNVLTGWLGGLSGGVGFVNFWLMHAAMQGTLLLVVLAASGPLRRRLASVSTGAPAGAGATALSAP